MSSHAGIGARPWLNTAVVTGGLLMIAAIVWTAMVIETIPPGSGAGDVGARAFPMLLGVALMLMSSALLLSGLMIARSGKSPEVAVDDEAAGGFRRTAFGPAFMIFAHIVAYGLMMEPLGFLFASAIIVASIMVVCVGDRSPKRVVGMSIGVSLGVWLVFGKLFGVYLTPGSWF